MTPAGKDTTMVFEIKTLIKHLRESLKRVQYVDITFNKRGYTIADLTNPDDKVPKPAWDTTPKPKAKAKTLEEIHGIWGEHPKYPKEDWRYEVACDCTVLGYWDWVRNQPGT